jgi:transcriptional regulator with XRE-family HTH domain
MVQTPISSLLAEARARRGLSVREAAALAGVPPSSLARWEHGSPIPSDDLGRVARGLALGVRELGQAILGGGQ